MEHSSEFLAHYSKRYNQWAGNSNGNAPNYGKCCEKVWSNHLSHQCSRKNGHGPDGAYCKQHDPEIRKRRQEVSGYKYNFGTYQRRIRSYGPLLDIVKKIAEGHNEPRQLCMDWLEENDDKLKPPAKPDHMED